MAARRLERARDLNQGYTYHPPEPRVVITRAEVEAYLAAVTAGASHWAAMQAAGHAPRPGEFEALLARLDEPARATLDRALGDALALRIDRLMLGIVPSG